MTNQPLRPPDFFLIGVPRSGTTSLYDSLCQHPRIFSPPLKEACFTCPDIDPGTRRVDTRFFYDQAEYLQLSADAAPNELIGDGCVYNIYSPEAPRRILELNPDARILVQLRDPIEQMHSNHALKLIMADSSGSFEDVLARQKALRDGRTEQPLNLRDYDLRDKASVSVGLRRFLDAFPRERVYISLYDLYAADPPAVVRSIYEFLGIDSSFMPNVAVLVPNRVTRVDRLNRAMVSKGVLSGAKRVLPGALHPLARRLASAIFRLNRRRVARPPLEPTVLAALRDELLPEVEGLSAMTGQDLVERWWGRGSAQSADGGARSSS